MPATAAEKACHMQVRVPAHWVPHVHEARIEEELNVNQMLRNALAAWLLSRGVEVTAK